MDAIDTGNPDDRGGEGDIGASGDAESRGDIRGPETIRGPSNGASADRRDPNRGHAGRDAPYRQAHRARTLLLRCWLEPSGAAPSRLRGTVRDLAGGDHRTFEDFDDLVALLRLALGSAFDRPFATSGE